MSTVRRQVFLLLPLLAVLASRGAAPLAAQAPGGSARLLEIAAPPAPVAAAGESEATALPLAGRLSTGAADSASPAERPAEPALAASTVLYRALIDLPDSASVESARAAGLAAAQPGEREYEVSPEVFAALASAGLDPALLGGVTTHRFTYGAPAGAAAGPETGESDPRPPGILATPGDFYISSGTVNDFIPDQGWAWRWVQVGGGSAAPPGSVTTSLRYRLRVHNDSSPASIYCGDYEIYLSSAARGGATPHWLVYNNLGGRTDGGFDDDAADDSDIYLDLRSTSHFNGEDPNQRWYAYIIDNLGGDFGYLQYIEFQVFWNAPDTVDLQAIDVYLRTQTGDAGSRIDSPTAGQQLYPHFTFSLAGGSLNGTIWRVRLDGATTLCTFTGAVTPGTYVGWCNSPWTVASGLHNLNGTLDPNGSFSESNENNNQANRNYSVPSPLDLQATDVYFRDQPGNGGSRIDSPAAGQTLYPHFTYNVTGASASGTIWRIELDGSARCTFDGSHSPGSYVGWCNSPWTAAAGAHTLRGILDPNGGFAESNEGNNQSTRNYNLPGGSPDIRVEPLTLTFGGAPLAAGGAREGVPASAPSWIPKQRVLPALMARAEREGAVRVIARLDAPFAPEGTLTGAQAVTGQRGAIQRLQDQLLGSLAGTASRLVARYRFIPYLALEVDSAGLAALRDHPSVLALEEDVPVPPTLASSIPVIGADDAWAAGYTGSGQVVAVLDTGVDKSHPFFSTGGGKVVSEACYSSNTTSSSTVCPGGATESTATGSGVNCPVSVNGCNHGTHVAGIAAGNNGTGPNLGVARGANLIAVQVFSRFDGSSSCFPNPAPCVRTFTSDQIKGLERIYALRSTFNIAAVNMSLGGGQYFDRASCDAANSSRKAAIDNLRSAGIATVIAAGNDGYRDSMGAPGCISSAVSVGATTDADGVASFSNVASFLDLFAPGVSITSSVPGTGTASFDGTSMATPHVAGAWAVLKQAKPGATVAEVLAALRSTGTLVDDNRSGGTVDDIPRINVDDAVDALLGTGGGRSFTIFNDGSGTLSVTSMQLQPSAGWITWSPQAPFDIAPGASVQVTVNADLNGAPPGQSTYRLLVSSNDADESPYPNGVFIVVNRPQTCYPLTRTHTGSGSDPAASPSSSAGCPSGQYHAGATINLTASPAAGWSVASWSGTNNNGSTSTGNTATMPAGPHAVAVHYQQGAASGTDFYTVTPCRVFDTRSGPPLISGVARTFNIASFCGVPGNARSISVNVTVVRSTAPGYIVLYPGDGTVPLASTINFGAAQVRANNAVLQLGQNGTLGALSVLAGGGQVDLILDVNGYFQ